MAAEILRHFDKGDDETLDFTIDWSSVLGSDTISTSAWATATGITEAAESNTTTTATVWLSGGTLGSSYETENTIVTTGGRTHTRTLKITIVDR